MKEEPPVHVLQEEWQSMQRGAEVETLMHEPERYCEGPQSPGARQPWHRVS